MVIYIITKCGRTLKDEWIQRILEQLSLAEKTTHCFYRCPSIYCDHENLVKEIGQLKDKPRFIFYDTMDNWMVISDTDQDNFIQTLKDPSKNGLNLNEILAIQLMMQ